MMKRPNVAVRSFVLCLLLTAPGQLRCDNVAPKAPTYELDVSGHTLHVEVAQTDGERRTGLMYRMSLAPDHGMLFILDEKYKPAFWMKDTYVPLDVAFISDNGTILQIEQMAPLSTERVVSKYNVQYALEAPQGYFEANHVGVGDKVGLSRLLQQLSGS